MSELLEALRNKYRTPAEAIRALGLDAALLTQEKPPMLSQQALMAKRVLNNYFRPRLAQDARPNFDSILKGVTEKNWRPQAIAKDAARLVRPKLAQDADLTEIAQALAAVSPTIAAPDPTGGGGPVVAAVPPDQMPVNAPPGLPPAPPPAPEDLAPNASIPPEVKDKDDNNGQDAGEVESWLQQEHPDVYAEWQQQSGGSPPPADKAMDADPDDPNAPPAQDRVHGGRNVVRGRHSGRAHDEGQDPDDDDNKAEDEVLGNQQQLAGDQEDPAMQPPDTKAVNTAAMDAAIKKAQQQERENQRAIQRAQREVRPWVGDFAMDMAFDSAGDVYKKALDMLHVPTKDLHPDAYAPILRAQPRPGQTQAAPRPVAQDSGDKSDGGFLTRFPEAANTMLG